MAVIGYWGGHNFLVTSGFVRSFENLTIKGSSETEDKEADGEKFVNRKNAKPVEITMTVKLNALTGPNVRDEALAFINEAKVGRRDYMYLSRGSDHSTIGSQPLSFSQEITAETQADETSKLVPSMLMLTDASIDNIQIAPNNTWVMADVKLTFKQATKNDGTTEPTPVETSGGGGGGGRPNINGKIPGIVAAVSAVAGLPGTVTLFGYTFPTKIPVKGPVSSSSSGSSSTGPHKNPLAK